MIENLIFDLDGTIINSYPHFVEFFYEVCRKNGVEVPYGRETVYRMLKITVPQAYCRLNCEDKMSYEKFYSDFVELYTENYKKLTGFEQTIDIIRRAKKAGKKNYIYTIQRLSINISNKPLKKCTLTLRTLQTKQCGVKRKK